MAATLPILPNFWACRPHRVRRCTLSEDNGTNFQWLSVSAGRQLCFRQQGSIGQWGKIQGVTLKCDGKMFPSRKNSCKVNGVSYLTNKGNNLSISPLFAWGSLKRNIITFFEARHQKSIDVLDGQEEKRLLLEDRMNQHRHAIIVDEPKATLGVMGNLGSFPSNDNLKEYAEDISELEGQLQELFDKVQRMMETGDMATAREIIEANYAAVTEQLEMGVKGVEQAAMLDILAQLYMSLCDFDSAEHMLEQTKEIMANVRNQEPLVDSILDHMGDMYTAIEKPNEALPLYTRSLQIQEAILGKESPLIVKLKLSLASTYNTLDEGLKSIELYRQAISTLEKRNGAESEDLVLPLTHLSHVLIEEGKVEEAEVSLSRVLKIMEKLHGENDERVGVATCVLARAMCAKGKVNDAIHLYKKGLWIMKNNGSLSLDDPALETARTDLAELLHVLGREQESQEVWEQNLLIKEEVVGSDHPSLLVHLQNLATSFAYSGKFEKCELLLRRSLKIASTNMVRDTPEVSVPLLYLATTLYHLGKNKEAEELAEEALRIREASFDKESPLIGEACDCLALICHALGKDDEAEPLMWRVLQIQEKEFGYDSREVKSTLEMLIVLLGNLGKKSERLPLLRRLTKLKAKYED